MLTRILGVVAALLAALVVHQYSQIGELRADVANAQERGVLQARAAFVDSMGAQGAEIQRTMTWLNDYYKSSEGLQRPGGLWIDGHPDYEGLSIWVFTVYLPHRLKGESEDQSRQAIVDAVKQSEEWRTKHRG
jgi:hypothetical protein